MALAHSPGRPPLDMDLRNLIHRMWRDNATWGEDMISRELAHSCPPRRSDALPHDGQGRRIMTMTWHDQIAISSEVRSGKPCIKGTRIAVYDVLEYLAGGMTEDQILGDFPELTRENIRACLAFAAARERRLFNSAA